MARPPADFCAARVRDHRRCKIPDAILSALYLSPADKYPTLTRQPSQGTKRPKQEGSQGIPASLSPLVTSRSRPCGRMSPAQAPSPCRFLPLGLLIPPLAGAMAARGTVGLLARSRHDRSTQRPSRAYEVATAWPSPSPWSARAAAKAGARRYEANRNCSTRGTKRAAAAGRPHPCIRWSPVAPPRPHAGASTG